MTIPMFDRTALLGPGGALPAPARHHAGRPGGRRVRLRRNHARLPRSAGADLEGAREGKWCRAAAPTPRTTWRRSAPTSLPWGSSAMTSPGDALLHYFRERHISTRHIVRVQNYLTPTKTRILGGLSHWQRQQIVRIDREPAHPLAAEVRTGLTRDSGGVAGLLDGHAGCRLRLRHYQRQGSGFASPAGARPCVCPSPSTPATTS